VTEKYFGEKWAKQWSRIRDKALNPFAKVFSAIGATPDRISYFSVILMLGFLYFIRIDYNIALMFLILTLFSDMMDGVLARYQKVESDRGKFVDVVCDNVNYFLFLIGLVMVGLLHEIIALFLVYFIFMSDVFRVMCHGVILKSDWKFKAVVGFLPNLFKNLTYALFFATVFWKIVVFNYIAVVSVLFLIWDSGYHYTKILHMKK